MRAAGGFLEAGLSLGRQLIRDAIWDDDRCVWLDWVEDDQGPRFETVDSSLYQGLSGIACFLAELSTLEDDQEFKTAAQATFRTLEWRLQNGEAALGSGLMHGRMGLAFAFFLGGRLLRDRALMDRGLALAAEFCTPSQSDVSRDLINGGAGIGLALQHIYLCTGREPFADAARRRAIEVGESLRKGGPGLTGLSEGAAGFILFLARMAERPDSGSFANEIADGLSFETSHRLPKFENWRDLRPNSGGESRDAPMWAWCQGAPGLSLSRLALWSRRQDFPGVPRDLEWALKSAAKSVSERRFVETASECLCHGRLGNALILNFAGEELERADLVAEARSSADAAAQLFLTNGEYRLGYGSERINLGFMTGLAGAGLAFCYFGGHRSELISSLFLGRPGIVV